MDELFEALTLVQTHKVNQFPVVLVGTAYWSGLLDWLRGTMLADGYLSPGDLDLRARHRQRRRGRWRSSPGPRPAAASTRRARPAASTSATTRPEWPPSASSARRAPASPPRTSTLAAQVGRRAGPARPLAGLRRRRPVDDGRRRPGGARRRGAHDRRHPRGAARQGGRRPGGRRAARRRRHAHPQGAHGLALGRVPHPARRARHARGAHRGLGRRARSACTPSRSSCSTSTGCTPRCARRSTCCSSAASPGPRRREALVWASTVAEALDAVEAGLRATACGAQPAAEEELEAEP